LIGQEINKKVLKILRKLKEMPEMQKGSKTGLNAEQVRRISIWERL